MPHCRCGADESLPRVTFVGEDQYCIYGDSGYNQRPFLEVPNQGSNLSTHQRAFNGAMSKARATVEWYFREIQLYWSTADYKGKTRTGE